LSLVTRGAVVFEAGGKRPYHESRPVSVEQVEVMPPGFGEILIRVAGAGVCHSDIAVIKGVRRLPLPVLLGHECSAVVEELGEGVKTVEKGDHVVLSYVPSCGQCVYCATGRPSLCEIGRASNGKGVLISGESRLSVRGKQLHHHLGVSAFAEYAVVSERSVIPVRKDLPLEKLALFGCAILTGIGSVLNTAQVKAGRTVAVFGCGGVGLNVIQGARIAGAGQIIAVDVVESKLRMAESFGATDTVDASSSDPVEAIKRLTAGAGVDYAFEAIGNTKVMAQAFHATKKGGQAIIIGITSPEDQVTISSSMLVDEERVLRGSFMGSVVPRRDIPMLIDLYAAGKVKLDELVSRYIKLDDINEALEALAQGEVARQIIKMR